MKQICDLLEKDVENIIRVIEAQGPNVPRNLFDTLKTQLYNQRHLCHGPVDKVAKILPPPPHKVVEEVKEFAERVTER